MLKELFVAGWLPSKEKEGGGNVLESLSAIVFGFDRCSRCAR